MQSSRGSITTAECPPTAAPVRLIGCEDASRPCKHMDSSPYDIVVVVVVTFALHLHCDVTNSLPHCNKTSAPLASCVLLGSSKFIQEERREMQSMPNESSSTLLFL